MFLIWLSVGNMLNILGVFSQISLHGFDGMGMRIGGGDFSISFVGMKLEIVVVGQ